MSPLDFTTFRVANVKRCEDVFDQIGNWSLTDWACAAAGEMGEACNIVKKIRREDFTIEEARPALAHELADVVIYLDLLAARCGIDLGEAVREKFNIVSAKRGSEVRL